MLKANGECQGELEGERGRRAWAGLWQGLGGAEKRCRREDCWLTLREASIKTFNKLHNSPEGKNKKIQKSIKVIFQVRILLSQFSECEVTIIAPLASNLTNYFHKIETVSNNNNKQDSTLSGSGLSSAAVILGWGRLHVNLMRTQSSACFGMTQILMLWVSVDVSDRLCSTSMKQLFTCHTQNRNFLKSPVPTAYLPQNSTGLALNAFDS